MKTATPALDRLTVEVKSHYLAGGAEAAARKDGRSLRAIDGFKAFGAIKADSIGAFIRQLHTIGSFQIHGQDKRDHEQAIAVQRAAREDEISDQLAEELFTAVEDASWAIADLTREHLEQYSDTEIGAILVELFHIDYDEFDPDKAENELDYNADDELPEECETPHDYLSSLASRAVVARLIKQDGPSLLSIWMDARKH